MSSDDNIYPIAVARLLRPGERARRVPSASQYFVTDHGRVISTVRGEDPYEMQVWPNTKGYLQVDLVHDDREEGSTRKWKPFVHTIVLLAFVGSRPTDPDDPHACFDARHLDGDKANNHLSNLTWARRAVNRRDNFRHGLRCGKRPGTGLTPVGVWRLRCRTLTDPIRKVTAEGAVTYGITERSIRDAIRGRVWEWMPHPHDPPTLAEFMRVLGVSEEQAVELLALVRPGDGRRAA